MTKEQRDKAVELCKAKSSKRAVKVATTLGSNPPLSVVSDKVDKLARAVKQLETSTEDSGLVDYHKKSGPSRDRSRSGSSSRSCGSNQSGAHSSRRKHWQSGHLGSRLNSQRGTQPRGVSVETDACQLDPGLGSHRSVRRVRTVCLPRTIGSTRSRCNVLRVELDSHADTLSESP